MKSLEQTALNELGSKLDQSEAEALENLYKELQIEFRKKMDERRQKMFAKNSKPVTNALKKLVHKFLLEKTLLSGVNENVAQQILKEYHDHIRQLDERHESQKQKLMTRLQEVLNERKSQLSNQVDKEITYQMELRKEQTNVVKYSFLGPLVIVVIIVSQLIKFIF